MKEKTKNARILTVNTTMGGDKDDEDDNGTTSIEIFFLLCMQA